MSIGIDIQGEHGTIHARVLRDALDELLGLLSSASEEAGAGRQDWTIAALEVGSAVVAVRGADEAPVSQLLGQGLAKLRAAPAVPSAWSTRMVERVIALGSSVGKGGATGIRLTGVALAPVEIDTTILVNARRALGAATTSVGSFRGVVDRWNEHGKREIGLALDDGGSLTVSYGRELSEKVRRDALRQRVEVWGLVSRNPAGQPVGMTMDDFEVLPSRGAEIVSISDLVGLYVVDGERPFTLDEWLEARGE